jgi:hypothetical protein
MESIDRSEVSRALAKAIAYKNCGKQAEAEAWAVELVKLLKCANILTACETCVECTVIKNKDR